MHRVRSSVLFVAALLASGLTACAGAENEDLFAQPPATSNLSKTDPKPAASKTGASKTGADAPAAGVPGGSPKGDPARGPGNEPRVEPGVDPNQPVPAEGCVAEVEGNDSPDEATTFKSCITGVVGGNRDTDFLRIVAPPNARKMLIDHNETDGRVLYRVTKEGDLMSLLLDSNVFVDSAPELRVTPGNAYVFKVSAPPFSPNERSYSIHVTFSGR